mmetsp:Transcript_32390/g.72715  ORF Transcript_32390/g.72715 Transcript_32390/m.72715 type:complete len:200 (+) Transcript_32390:1-600(+)
METVPCPPPPPQTRKRGANLLRAALLGPLPAPEGPSFLHGNDVVGTLLHAGPCHGKVVLVDGRRVRARLVVKCRRLLRRGEGDSLVGRALPGSARQGAASLQGRGAARDGSLELVEPFVVLLRFQTQFAVPVRVVAAYERVATLADGLGQRPLSLRHFARAVAKLFAGEADQFVLQMLDPRLDGHHDEGDSVVLALRPL